VYSSLAAAAACGHAPTAPPPALSITCPLDVSTQATTGQTAVPISFPSPAVTGGKQPVTTTCTPASGASFAIGDTHVSCSASDAAQQSATCSFVITVQPPPAPPKLSLTRFMAFGDSMTEGKIGFAYPTLVFPTSYTLKLEALLETRYSDQAPSIVVIDEGLGGERAVDAVSSGRFAQALSADQPQVLLLMDGSNDLLDSGAAAIPDIVKALDAMGSRAAGRGVTVFLATLPPENPQGRNGTAAAAVAPLNAQIASLATSRQWTLVDVYAAFKGDLGLIGSDGLHPTDAGYDVIAQAFFERITAKLEVPQGVYNQSFTTIR
jgi:lysophospholipase L1-like esterase